MTKNPWRDAEEAYRLLDEVIPQEQAEREAHPGIWRRIRARCPFGLMYVPRGAEIEAKTGCYRWLVGGLLAWWRIKPRRMDGR